MDRRNMSTSVFGRRPSAGVKGRFLLRRAVAVLTTSVAFLALGAFFSVQQLAAQTLDQSHYRWRNDDGGKKVPFRSVPLGLTPRRSPRMSSFPA